MIKISFRDKIASENIKFWISPEGKFFHWPSDSVMSRYDPHHVEKIHKLSGGKIETIHQALAAGWVSGGNINRQLYLRSYNFESAIENMRTIPLDFLHCDKLYLDTEASGAVEIDTHGANPILSLVRYMRDKR